MQIESIKLIILAAVILLIPAIDLLTGVPLNAFGAEPNKNDE
jgi:hypothetical protein